MLWWIDLASMDIFFHLNILYRHFRPLKHPYTAKTVPEIFVKEIVRLHGFSKSIVSDRDKVFRSHFWRKLFRLTNARLNYNTTYHPQTYGQTEVVNRGVENYLRCFCGEKSREWVRWLHVAEYWYNTTYQRSLGITLFQAVYDRTPPSFGLLWRLVYTEFHIG